MPVELRKRKAPAAAPEPSAKKPAAKVAKAASKAKETVKEAASKPAPAANGSTSKDEPNKHSGKVAQGDVIDLDGFGGEIETNDGTKTSLKALVDESKAGVVLFTYPKASTPGCTTQACLFRDSYESLTAGGLAIYGLSKDSPKSNTTFKTKQNLPYPLLCDPKATLIGAIGMKKAPASTQRGIFVVDKEGKVLLCSPGSPAGTVDMVKELVAGSSGGGDPADEKAEKAEKADEHVSDDAKEDGPNGDAQEDEKEDGEKKDH